MTNELIEFLKCNQISTSPDYYGIIGEYIFDKKSRATPAEKHRFTKYCVFFTSDAFFNKHSYSMAYVVMALGLANCSTDEVLKKLLTARKMIEVMWPGWFEFLREKEEKGEKVHAGDS